MWEFLKKSVFAFCTDANHYIYWATSGRAAWSFRSSLASVMSPRRRCSFLMPTRSFCSETHQSVCCLIGSERWESIAICTPAPKSSLWTCHSRRVTCICLVLHLTKGSPISSGGGWGGGDYTHNIPILSPRPSALQQRGARWRFVYHRLYTDRTACMQRGGRLGSPKI